MLAPVWHPSAALLAAQLLAVLLYPFTDQSPAGRAAFSLFGVVVLALAVRAVQASPALTWVSIVLGAPILVITALELADPTNLALALAAALLFMLFYSYTSYALVRYMFHERAISAETLFATAATFTVLAWAFAYLFAAVQIIWPGSFSGVAPGATGLGWFDLLFLSFTTLTSVGLSDIVPILPHSRSVVMIEEVAGLMYVALVVSRVAALAAMRERGQVRVQDAPSTADQG
jgi:hypothetical protein